MKNHYRGFILALLWTVAFVFVGTNVSFADAIVTFEAESGTLGANFSVNAGSPAYITITTDGAGGNPGSAARVASYTVNFPSAGTYKLYGRVRVGAGGANDDSSFYGNGFGAKSATTDAGWILINGINVGGFENSSDVVSGSGASGLSVWKWISFSDYTGTSGETPVSFTVTAGNLTPIFQIGARENGLDFDKFAFGTSGAAFTVSNLDTGTLPPASNPNTNLFAGPDGIAFHRFSPLTGGINADGANPAAGLTLSGGVLVGTTLNGGSQGAGTAFWMTLDGTNFSTFRTFANEPDAGNPQGELSFSGNGFFSTSSGGGASGVGAIIAGQTNGSVSLLRSFTTVSADNATNSSGASPSALIALAGGTLFGTTTAGGAAGNGAVFSLTTNGATFAVLHNFSALDSQMGTNTDGAVPQGGLILSGDKLYGAASAGGAGGNGVVFSLSTNGANFTVLYGFASMDTLTATNADGAMPVGGLVLSNSTLYGTTFTGGQGGRGTVFSIQINGLGFTVLHHFTAVDSVTATNTDGASPCAGLIFSSNVLYGTASAGGTGTAGTVFSLNLANQQFTAIRSFTPLSGNGTNTDGAFPVTPVLRVGGSLYGTTFSGGPGAAGTVFSVLIPAPPAIITNVVSNLNGTVTLYFLGGPNTTNLVQSTANLTPPVAWQSISINVADENGAWQFTDSNNTATRFYRSYAP